MTGPTQPDLRLFDTDLLIDHLRGRPEATRFLQGTSARRMISAITVAELYAGIREGGERDALERLLVMMDLVQVTAELAQAGGLIRRDYGKSHGVGLADAIIAATAIAWNATLCTLNVKHYPMLETLLVPYRK